MKVAVARFALLLTTVLPVVVAWLPVAFYFHLLLFAARVYRRFGYWPRYTVTPDPTALATTYGLTAQPVDVAMPLLFLVAASGITLTLIRRRAPVRRSPLVASAVALIMWALAVGIARVDPGGIVAWSID